MRVVRFYVSLLLLPPASFLLRRSVRRLQPRASRLQCALPDINREPLRAVFPAGPLRRADTPSVPCRTSTASLCGQFNAGPQLQPSVPSVPCRTSTSRANARKNVGRYVRKTVRMNIRRYVRKNARKNVSKYARMDVTRGKIPENKYGGCDCFEMPPWGLFEVEYFSCISLVG